MLSFIFALNFLTWMPLVHHQVKSSTYDFEANKALLKLYQFFPDLCKPESVALMLTKVSARSRHIVYYPGRSVHRGKGGQDENIQDVSRSTGACHIPL